MPLARRILADSACTALLLTLAAWRCVYLGDGRELREYCYEAAGVGCA